MTSEEKVKRVYPKATVQKCGQCSQFHCWNGADNYDDFHLQGDGDTEEDAWDDAAKRIKAQQSAEGDRR